MDDTHLEKLRKRHRALDRLIDTTKALSRQGELAQLKRQRLRLKDRIAQAAS
ncbi:YdcH family protein [Aurantiacibacter suaedae]|uniref:YdcH family protein n=1 Tax=Aurantiacibacter suaedae TaxID=2545755 RepID=UPI0010FA2F09|nr:YdcH family protein [Aurantiacibacter suaedae]